MMPPNTPPPRGTPQYADYVIQLAKGGLIHDGVINEPRVFWDEIEQDGTDTIKFGNPGIFQNGEQFPIRLTRMIATTRFFDEAGTEDSEINVQRIGLRMKFHDQFYMNPLFVPIPAWGNTVTATPPTYNQSAAMWDFVANGQPFILSARDTLRVEVQLENAPAQGESVPVDVTATGIGVLSKRPYMFNGQVDLADTNPVTLSTVDFRNDGSEPIAITDMSVHCGPESGAADPQGNLRRLRLNIRQVGNGTNADWFEGPQVPVAIPLMPAPLFGVSAGRAVVHQFPGDGVIWQPGEGISIETRGVLQGQIFDSWLVVALAGYIMVV